MSQYAFAFIPVQHLVPKPRTRSVTMMIDLGLPLLYQQDVLRMAAEHIDLAKVAIGIGRVLKETYLRQKVALYREYDVMPFPGGIFLEYAHVHGLVDAYLQECQRLGFTAVEISDNYIHLSPEEKAALIRRARDAFGFRVLAEVGRKEKRTDVEVLVEDMRTCLDAGASFVLIEAAEFLENPDAAAQIRYICQDIPPEKILFEMPGRWLPGVRYDTIIRTMGLLFRLLGPEVNVANVAPEDVLGLAAQRVGIGTTFQKTQGAS